MVAYGPHGKISESWFGSTAPTTKNVGTASTWVGGVFDFAGPGRIFGFRAYRLAGADQCPVAALWTGFQLLRAYNFRDVTVGADGWTQCWIRPSFRINVSTSYAIAILFPGGHYSRTNTRFASGPVTVNGIVRSLGFQSTVLAPWTTSFTSNTNANGIDILWQAD